MTSYNDFLELVTNRYSCRSYESRKIDREILCLILETARLAPSAVNRQPWTFLVLDSEAQCQAISECYGREWVKTAPAFIVAIGNHTEAWHRAEDNKDHTDIDLAIAVEHICLAATSLGLGSCWICNFNVRRCRELLNLPDSAEPVAIIPVGYPADKSIPEKKRKSSDDIIRWGAL